VAAPKLVVALTTASKTGKPCKLYRIMNDMAGTNFRQGYTPLSFVKQF